MAGGWKDRLALTGTEKKVFLFLLVTFTAGLTIRFLRDTFPGEGGGRFDYRASDSTFVALSNMLALEPESLSVPKRGPVNLNTASKQELMSLPGIGEVIAERIILYREDVGPFSSIEQLRKVKGINKKKLEQLKPLISIH